MFSCSNFSLDVNFCKDHRNKIEVPDPLAVEDLISSKLNNKRKFARLITQYRDIMPVTCELANLSHTRDR